MPNEVIRVEVEMRAREALQQFEKLDQQFRETAGSNKALYQQLHREHRKYVGDVERENKKRAADEKWLTQSLQKEGEKRKGVVLKEAREERQFANQLTKEMQQRVKDERWLTRELEKEQKQRERDVERAAREAERANQKTSRGGRGGAGFGGIGDKIFAANAVFDAARGLKDIADWGFRAADGLAAAHRGLETVYGSAERAAERFDELNELAKFPALDPEPLARFDAIFKNLGATAEQNDILFRGTAKAVTTFGGDAFSVSSVMYQLSQAFSKNKIEMQDFKIIQEQTGGTFLKVAEEVLGFTGGIEGLQDAFKATGDTAQNYLMPVFAQLDKQFEGAPVDSYTTSVENLGVAFKNWAAAMTGNTNVVGKYLNLLTEFLEGEKELWENMRTGGKAIKAVGDESKVSAAELRVLQKDLFRVNTTLKEAEDAYQDYLDNGVHPNTAAMEQLKRKIDNFTTSQETLKETVDKSKTSLTGMLKPVKDSSAEFRVLKVDIDAVDTRFMTFRERGAALKGTISELPPELTKVREGLQESTTWAENIEKQFDKLRDATEKVYDVFVDLNDGLDDYAEKAEQAWAASKPFLTDISGAERPGADFTAAQRRLHQPANIENNRRSYATSPRGDHRGTQSDAFLGITTKVREFEQVTDISIDKLDEFSAQTQHTAKELEKLNQKELAEFSKSLFDIVNAVDTLTPVLEGFGVDLTSQRSGGRLATNTASGVGQVLSGDVFGGVSNIIKSMWEWGQPDRDALQKQHEEALKRERQRVAKIQSELDAYTAQRENLFAARMDFLQHGGSTFSDWTDTLKSFSDHDLKRGREVFVSFSEAMDAFNSAANQARLKLDPTAGSVQYNLYQRGQAIRAGAPTAGQTAAAAAREAESNSRAARDAEAAAIETVDQPPGVSEEIARIIETVETRTANRFAQDALAAITETAADVNATETTIIERWNQAVPKIENWWTELYDDIVNNPDLTEIERTESLSELGTQQDFVSRLKAQYVTPVLMGIAQATEALETRTANRLAQEALGAITEAAGDVNATEQEILFQWTAAIPALENWWQELYDDIINNPTLSDAQESESLAALGSQQDFVASLKSQYVTPVLSGIAQAAEALQTRTANRLAQMALGAISEAAGDANITEDAIVTLWNASIPALEAWYQELLDDANAIENDAERTEALAALGSPEAFVANLKAQYVTPVITAIRTGAEALQTRTANRVAQSALKGLREATSDVNITEAEVINLWTATVPLIEIWYQELLDDANAIADDAERTEALAALGSPEAFIASLKSQYVTPVITGIQRSAEALETKTASRVANTALKGLREATGDVNITEDAILGLWNTALPLIETWYQELLEDANAIENDAERTEALAALGSPEAFVANLKSQYVTPVLTGIAQSTEALQTRTANRQAQGVIGALRTVADDVNVTEQAIIDKWQEAVPFIETWWQELYDDIVNNASLTDDDIAESLAELGSVEAFVGNIRSQYVTPVLNNILGTQFQNRSNAAQNRVNRARVDLSGATSESDFETRRGLVIAALNAYYDAEEERIDNLEKSEEVLSDLREDNQLAREQAIGGAINVVNTFAADRIRIEEQTQAELERIEERRLKDIQSLRDDAIEAEKRRLEREADLHKRQAEKLMGIEKRRLQAQADNRSDHFRTQEDIIIATARRLFDEAITSSSQLTGQQLRQVYGDTGFIERISDMRRDERRENVDLATTTQRAISTADTQLAQGIIDVNQDAVGKLTEIYTTLGSIDESLSFESTFGNIRESIEMGLTPFVKGITEIFEPLRKGSKVVGDLLNPTLSTSASEMLTKELAGPADRSALAESLSPMPEQVFVPPTEMTVDRISINAQTVELHGDVNIDAPPQQQPSNMTVVIDSEQIVTPRFAEKVSDQLSINDQSGSARR